MEIGYYPLFANSTVRAEEAGPAAKPRSRDLGPQVDAGARRGGLLSGAVDCMRRVTMNWLLHVLRLVHFGRVCAVGGDDGFMTFFLSPVLPRWVREGGKP